MAILARVIQLSAVCGWRIFVQLYM